MDGWNQAQDNMANNKTIRRSDRGNQLLITHLAIAAGLKGRRNQAETWIGNSG